MLPRIFLLALAALACAPGAAQAARSYDNCTGFIDSLPATITTQGTWCLRKDLSTAISSGETLVVATNNVTIDCNDFKIGNLAAGDATQAFGIRALDRSNVVVRHCNLRGFQNAIDLLAVSGGGNYVVEDNNVQSATSIAIHVVGDGSVIQRNSITRIGGSLAVYDAPVGILTENTVDVLDNTISGVSGEWGAQGIATSLNHGGSVSRNRVSNVQAFSGGMSAGIYNDTSGRMAIRDNHVSANGSTVGLFCFNNQGRARGNTIIGFATGMGGCADAGGNDIAP